MVSQIVEIENDILQDEICVGNLDSIRDYSDVRDVVRAYKMVIEKDFIPGEIFNICSGKGIKIGHLLDIILKCSTKQISVKIDLSRFRSVNVPMVVGNNNKFSKKYGWIPRYTIQQTVNDTMQYWRKQYQSIKKEIAL